MVMKVVEGIVKKFDNNVKDDVEKSFLVSLHLMEKKNVLIKKYIKV